MYHTFPSNTFKKSYAKIKKSGKFPKKEIDFVVGILAKAQKLPTKYRDHALLGEYFGCRECHIKPDLLLIYEIKNDILVLVLIDIGSHSELF